MSDDVIPAQAAREAARDARRKALLKSNMGRRKAQARARTELVADADETMDRADD